MSEPEDLILDGAHAASRAGTAGVASLPAARQPPVLPLADVRVRLELLVHALFGVPIAISPAEPGGAGQLAGAPRAAARALDPREIWPGTDGVRICFRAVPRRRRAAPSDPMALYQLLAVEQAIADYAR